MRQNILFGALSALAAVVVADFPLDPNAVDLTLRNQWCSAQQTSCPILCGGDYKTNDCYPETLKYSCICPDGKSPELSKYIQTMPTFICMKAFEICNTAHQGQKKEQDNCTTSIKDNCGTLDPSKAEVDSGSSKSSAAPSTTAPAQTSVSEAAPTSTKSSAAMATNAMIIGNGVAAIAAGVFAAALL